MTAVAVLAVASRINAFDIVSARHPGVAGTVGAEHADKFAGFNHKADVALQSPIADAYGHSVKFSDVRLGGLCNALSKASS